MDFLDPHKKRKHRIRLFAGYGLMAILITLGATILLFEASGFDVDRRTGELIHNGLVFVDAHPEPAEVFLNGEHQGRTDMRLVIPEGRYDLELRRDGYRSWKQDFRLEGSKIERFVYPFLFPSELKPTDVQLYAKQPELVSQSPDRRWLLVQQPGKLTEFDVFDLRTKNADTKPLILPDTLLTKAAGNRKLEIVEWSSDNRNVLMKHTYKGGTEFVVIDHVTPAKSINLNVLFKEPFTEVVLHDKRPDRFYLHDKASGVFSRAEADNGRVTLLLSDVSAFNTHDSKRVLYVTPKDAETGNVSVMIRDGDQEYKIRELPEDSQYLLNMARFDGAWYTAVGSPKEKKVYVYKGVITEIRQYDEILRAPVPEVILRTAKPEFLTISSNARFISLQGGSMMAVYDAEADRLHQYTVEFKLRPKQKFTWMDGHRLTTVVDGKATVMDFDGDNKQELTASGANFVPYFDRDYEVMYTVGPSSVVPGRSGVVQTPLLVD